MKPTKKKQIEVSCANFMQAFKCELWDSSARAFAKLSNDSKNFLMPSEKELDQIAMRLFDRFFKK